MTLDSRLFVIIYELFSILRESCLHFLLESEILVDLVKFDR
jgi:hypothetical protein